ncbi:TetR/AcrR family transcriptional regulator [Halioglobus maricola]|uniref:TetR/AcrR family transcriptional regulator n=1 Tax=Halioglobus maricola TaxID=2601894 RepID=A0A5P9NL46_9GAMM|nr:TetR/AcrR family transcriptional regulator [Halioglobus maricola]QFU76235.1 TetR/AcrR family transcriptional regulator [Halioglobus maricola]
MTLKSVQKMSKGERTAARIMDVAEDLFARQGYEGTSLRQIAAGAGIQEPGLYNHFGSKQGLYESVLFRALNPMAEAMSDQLNNAHGLRDYTDLPSAMTDLLLEHPQMAALFQQALQGDPDSLGNRLVQGWLDSLFDQGMRSIDNLRGVDADQETLALNVIAMFNLVTGYFLSNKVFASLVDGDIQAPENVERQKTLLRKVIRAMLVN